MPIFRLHPGSVATASSALPRRFLRAASESTSTEWLTGTLVLSVFPIGVSRDVKVTADVLDPIFRMARWEGGGERHLIFRFECVIRSFLDWLDGRDGESVIRFSDWLVGREGESVIRFPDFPIGFS